MGMDKMGHRGKEGEDEAGEMRMMEEDETVPRLVEALSWKKVVGAAAG